MLRVLGVLSKAEKIVSCCVFVFEISYKECLTYDHRARGGLLNVSCTAEHGVMVHAKCMNQAGVSSSSAFSLAFYEPKK